MSNFLAAWNSLMNPIVVANKIATMIPTGSKNWFSINPITKEAIAATHRIWIIGSPNFSK